MWINCPRCGNYQTGLVPSLLVGFAAFCPVCNWRSDDMEGIITTNAVAGGKVHAHE